MSNGWSDWVSDGEAAARAAGRRKYNALRRDRAQYRRIQVAELLMSDGWTYGAQARIAQELGVSDATICCDLKVIFPGAIQCPVCACRHPMERWRELERQGRVKLGPAPSDDEGSPPGCNEDGDVDEEDDHIETILGIWRQEQPGDPFVRLGSVKVEDQEELEAKLTGFSRYAIAY